MKATRIFVLRRPRDGRVDTDVAIRRRMPVRDVPIRYNLRATGSAIAAAALVVLGVQCGGMQRATPDDGGALDGGAIEAGPSDATPHDAAPVDAGPTDAGPDALADAGFDAVCGPPPPPYEAGAPIAVRGSVLGENGGPVYGAVAVTVEGQTTMAAADGSFSFAAVTPPYDLLLAYSEGVASGSSMNMAFLGLTRPDPTLVLPTSYDTAPATYLADVWVTVTQAGATWLPGPSQFGLTGIHVDSPSSTPVVGAEIAGGGPTDDEATWGDTPTTTGTLWGFGGSLLPTGGVASFDAVGSQAVTLDAGEMEDVTLAIAPGTFTATSLSGSLTVPAGCTAPSVDLVMNGWSDFPDQPSADAGTFRYGTLAGPFTWSLAAQCTMPAGVCGVTRGPLTGTEDVPITIPTPQTALVTPPSDGVLLAACPDFAWTPTPSSAYLVTYAPRSSAAPTYMVVTTKTSFRSPFPMPSGAWGWGIQQVSGYATSDDVTASFPAAVGILPYLSPNECSPHADTFTVQ
jgi:hypothetical protein